MAKLRGKKRNRLLPFQYGNLALLGYAIAMFGLVVPNFWLGLVMCIGGSALLGSMISRLVRLAQ